jgi:hypothetical protein
LRFTALVCVRLLHRKLQRAGRLFSSVFKVLVGHLQIVLLRDGLTMADPFANNVSGKVFRQLGLARHSKILE